MTTSDRARVPLLLLAVAMVATVACGTDSGSTSTTGVVSTTGTTGAVGPRSASELLDQALSSLSGEVELVSITGEALDLTDADVAALIESFASDAGDVEIAAAFQSEAGGPSFVAGAIRVPRRDWNGVLEALAESGEIHGVTYEWIEMAGRQVLRATAADEFGWTPVVYISLGDTVLYFQSSDQAAVESAVESLPESPEGDEPVAYDPPAPGIFPLMLVIIRQPQQPVCVAEPAGRHRLEVMAIDTGLGIPYPYTTFFVSGRLMDPNVAPQVGPMATYPYSAISYGSDGRELVQVEGISLAGGQGQTTLAFEVRHCLEGTWQDGDRVIRIAPPGSPAITAEVISGEICREEGGLDFSGTLEGDRLTGGDLKVCNPEECVDAGLLPASITVPFIGQVADDGQSVAIDWVGAYYEIEEDSSGNAISCTNTHTEDNQFTITRLTFGF
ncbi:MAG: hypothetical protein WD184_01805 [Acidimicrobiia bacterium]